MITGIGNIAPVGSAETSPLLSRPSAPLGADGDAFSAMVGTLATNTVRQLETAEALSFQALEGKAETREVVDAVMSAEQSLQAAIAIRDKIVTAYLEISRMAI